MEILCIYSTYAGMYKLKRSTSYNMLVVIFTLSLTAALMEKSSIKTPIGSIEQRRHRLDNSFTSLSVDLTDRS